MAEVKELTEEQYNKLRKDEVLTEGLTSTSMTEAQFYGAFLLPGALDSNKESMEYALKDFISKSDSEEKHNVLFYSFYVDTVRPPRSYCFAVFKQLISKWLEVIILDLKFYFLIISINS